MQPWATRQAEKDQHPEDVGRAPRSTWWYEALAAQSAAEHFKVRQSLLTGLCLCLFDVMACQQHDAVTVVMRRYIHAADGQSKCRLTFIFLLKLCEPLNNSTCMKDTTLTQLLGFCRKLGVLALHTSMVLLTWMLLMVLSPLHEARGRWH